MASKQYLRQKRLIASGKCACCAEPRNHYAHMCDECHVKHCRERARKRAGCKAWVPGGRGRPPKTYKPEGADASPA